MDKITANYNVLGFLIVRARCLEDKRGYTLAFEDRVNGSEA